MRGRGEGDGEGEREGERTAVECMPTQHSRKNVATRNSDAWNKLVIFNVLPDTCLWCEDCMMSSQTSLAKF